ncbi:MAG: pantoate--beta-alanine ligase [Deltaproteobacteria bacterium]|jgi:pantoate--beta-alanine ligase|nr:pantoate--beta-alanine ligase [Deltaproteobacteria bacterium]
MDIISDIKEMRVRSEKARNSGLSIAFVPTMGYLHEGHLSLLREGRERCDLLILSIFVNPTQFAPSEDLDRYPKDFQRDRDLAEKAGVDWIFCPKAEEVYPADFVTYVDVTGELTNVLEGASRPGHFRGVATVVTKLFNIIRPHIAVFGQKDFQQLAIIQRMVDDLNLDVEIVCKPIVRETDGLAMSSRNVYLSAKERQQSLAIFETLCNVSSVVRSGERSAQAILRLACERLAKEKDLVIDYVKCCDPVSLSEVEKIDSDTVMLVAVKIGKTRLIDNHILCQEVQIQ